MSLIQCFQNMRIKYQENKTLATQELIELDKNVDKLGLFSTNEDLNDLNPLHLKYLAIKAMLALSLLEGDSTLREFILLKSKALIFSYLDLLDCYQVVEKDCKVLVGKDAHLKSSVAMRDWKMKCFAVDKRLQSTTRTNAAHDSDSDTDRQYWIDYLSLLAIQSSAALLEIHRELEMIAFKKSLPSKPSGPSKTDSEHQLDGKPRLHQYSGPLLDSKGKPLRPFVLTADLDHRMNLQKEVFRPSHNLPTMSIDEYLDREMSRGNFLSGGGPSSSSNPESSVIDDLDFEKLDLDTLKQRQWDEFKDFNPAGWGNRHNKG